MHPIGSKKETILCVETGKISIRLIGERITNNTISRDDNSKIEINCLDAITNVEILDDKKECNQKEFASNLRPLFQEQKDYQLLVEYDRGLQVEFSHENKELSEKVSEKGRRETFLEGTLNFNSDIGYSELVFKVNGTVYLSIIIEVFPSKLDYKTDFKLMMRDIEEEVNRLSFDYLRKTYQQMDIMQKNNNSPMEFFQILQVIFQKFMESVRVILQNTHKKLCIQHQIMPEHKVRKTDASTRKWIVNHQQYVRKNAEGVLHFEKIKGVVKELTFDTNENRLVKCMLKTILTRLESFYEYSKKFRNKSEISKIREMKSSIFHTLNTTFLKSVGEDINEESMSLVFSLAPGYKELYEYYRMLNSQLSVCGSLFKMSIKDTATLYEYWCFLKLNRILKNNFHERKSTLIKVNSDGVLLQLKRGKESLVEYEDLSDGKIIQLIYNRNFLGLPTGAERPDYLLSILDKENKEEWNYIYDAKYRFDELKKGPKREDIEVMHRYRDAIVKLDNNGKYTRLVTGCFVLFPYWNEETYITHQYYNSIQLVGIGGLPFLPSTTSEVEKCIKRNIRRCKKNSLECIYHKEDAGVQEDIAITFDNYIPT